MLCYIVHRHIYECMLNVLPRWPDHTSCSQFTVYHGWPWCKDDTDLTFVLYQRVCELIGSNYVRSEQLITGHVSHVGLRQLHAKLKGTQCETSL